MELALKHIDMGFSLKDVHQDDLNDYLFVEKISHSKYIFENSEFLGESDEQILKDAFYDRIKMTFFKKILLNNEIVGFLNYDKKVNKIDNVLLKIMPKVQNKGIGTWFLQELKKYSVPIFLVVIKTNPAQNLYKRLGFEVYEEKNAFLFFKYEIVISAL